MAKARDPQRVGLTPYERDLLHGMVYVLVDTAVDNLQDHILGVFSTPVKAIEATHTDPGLWHHYYEHYWMGGGGQWEIIPFILDEQVEWMRKEWEAARPRKERDFYFKPKADYA